MIYKYTKCESVIAKIMADSNMSEKDMRVTDIREWIFEAVEKIGSPMLYIERESGIDECPIFLVLDYQIPIPDDLVYLTSVAYSVQKQGPYISTRTDNSLFKLQRPIKELFGFYKPTSSVEYKFHSKNFGRFDDPVLAGKEDITFFVKPGWIVLNRKEGFVKLSYKAIATDERGYPLIPDTPSYLEAIYWYVMMKLTFPKWLNGSFATKKSAKGAEYAYTYIQQQWNFYRNQAYAEAMMPTESEMRSIKNEWTKLVPEWDSDEIFFKSEGLKQLNYTDYYYGY